MSTVFVDVDTQLDFICAAGALYAPGAEQIITAVGRLTGYATANGIKVISTTDAHAENDREFEVWKPHCVSGTAGQRKIGASLLAERYVLENAGATLDRAAVTATKQVILEKQHVDCFTNAHLAELLGLLNVKSAVVYGLVTEVCVRLAAEGLAACGVQVTIVRDAVQPFVPEERGAGTERACAARGQDSDR